MIKSLKGNSYLLLYDYSWNDFNKILLHACIYLLEISRAAYSCYIRNLVYGQICDFFLSEKNSLFEIILPDKK